METQNGGRPNMPVYDDLDFLRQCSQQEIDNIMKAVLPKWSTERPYCAIEFGTKGKVLPVTRGSNSRAGIAQIHRTIFKDKL